MSVTGIIPAIKREEVRVYNHVKQTLVFGVSPSTVASSVFTEGAILHYKQLLRVQTIPTGRGWRWNQSRKKSELCIGEASERLRVIFTKLIPRKDNDLIERAPRYKLWHICLFRGSSLSSTVLYCERGEQPPPPPSALYSSNSHLEKDWNVSEESSPETANKMELAFLCN